MTGGRLLEFATEVIPRTGMLRSEFLKLAIADGGRTKASANVTTSRLVRQGYLIAKGWPQRLFVVTGPPVPRPPVVPRGRPASAEPEPKRGHPTAPESWTAAHAADIDLAYQKVRTGLARVGADEPMCPQWATALALLVIAETLSEWRPK